MSAMSNTREKPRPIQKKAIRTHERFGQPLKNQSQNFIELNRERRWKNSLIELQVKKTERIERKKKPQQGSR